MSTTPDKKDVEKAFDVFRAMYSMVDDATKRFICWTLKEGKGTDFDNMWDELKEHKKLTDLDLKNPKSKMSSLEETKAILNNIFKWEDLNQDIIKFIQADYDSSLLKKGTLVTECIPYVDSPALVITPKSPSPKGKEYHPKHHPTMLFNGPEIQDERVTRNTQKPPPIPPKPKINLS